jgi:hypothetical protein
MNSGDRPVGRYSWFLRLCRKWRRGSLTLKKVGVEKNVTKQKRLRLDVG